jgi:hypothetical protein
MLNPNFMVRSAVIVTAAGLMVSDTERTNATSWDESKASPAALVTLQLNTSLGPVPAWKETAGLSLPPVSFPPAIVQA